MKKGINAWKCGVDIVGTKSMSGYTDYTSKKG